ALIDEAHALAVSEPLQFTSDIMKHEVPLEARAQSELMIRIVDDKKAAIEDASIQIDQQPALEAALRLAMTFAMAEEERPARPVELRSDKEGSFATNWLASDEYTFSAAKKGFQGPPPAADGDTQSRRAMGSVATSTDRKSTLTLTLYGVRQLMGTVV